MTGLLFRASAGSQRVLCTPDLTGLLSARACAARVADPADAVPVPQVTWTCGQPFAADVPERHRHA